MPVKRACDVCFRRKIQCIKPDPNLPCEWCADHDLDCAVTRESQRKKPDDLGTLISQVQALTRRVTALEKTVEYLRSSIGASPALVSHITPLSSATTATAQVDSPSVTPQAYCSVRKVQNQVCFGQYWYFKGIPIFAEKGVDWMASKIGERPELNNFRLFGTQLSSESSPHPRLALPERQVVEELLSSFLHSQWQSMYPVMDPAAIEEVVNAAYNPRTVYGKGTSEAFVLAAVAMCSKFQNAEASTLLDGSVYANKAQSHLIQNPQESTNGILEMSIMLHIYRSLSGQWEDAAILHSIACRMIYDLKAHCFYHGPPSDQQRQNHLRNLFWLCYIQMSEKGSQMQGREAPRGMSRRRKGIRRVGQCDLAGRALGQL